MGRVQKGDLAAGAAAVCRRLAEPLAAQLGLSLWDVRFVKEGVSWYLRVFIDREDEAVTLDDCVALSRLLDPALDEADPISQSYCLEVCSPGIERELRLPEHFARFLGWPVRVRLIRPQDGQREWVGLLNDLTDGVLTVTAEDGVPRSIPLKETSSVCLLDDDDNEIGGMTDNE